MKKYLGLGIMGLSLAAAVGLTGCGSSDNSNSKNESEGFSPRLDTEAKVVLNTTGYFGNFEALDQVENDFNAYYPNVEFSYEQVSTENYESYIEANPGVDIVMTSQETFAKLGDKLTGQLADLAAEDVKVGDIEEDMLKMSYHDGKLTTIPMSQNMYGLIVNVSLLEKEGLSVPNNYEEFLNVLETLKEKGYTPIQGPDSKVYAELTENAAFDLILNDKKLQDNLKAGDASAVEALLPVVDRLATIIDNGYTDYAVNQTYPQDNYDQAILRFFEGDVPFWVCNTEKVSGMKKRESKSEAFQANPFTYTYIFAPLGDNGVYAYSEPWFGFSVNKDADDYDYAIEFMRFLATKDEINKIADVKGVPSVAKEKTGVAIYQDVLNPEKVEMEGINDGTITQPMISDWYTCMNRYASGEYASAKEALEAFVEMCAESK